jgi:hypothetical protein
MSSDPNYYANRIKLFIALAPISKMVNCRSSLIKYLAANIEYIYPLVIDTLGMYNFVPPNAFFSVVFSTFC